MKRIILIALAMMLAVNAFSQANSPCPGLKNPASFTSGSTSGMYVGYYSGQTGTKPYITPNALSGVTGVTMTSSVIPAGMLASTMGNSGSCGLNPSNRFRIMSNTDGPGTGTQVGKDPCVQYNLPYCPTSYDASINKSIRLGTSGTGAEAEALYYTMNVNTKNALLFIYYAIVVEAPGHGADGDPSFVIRVSKESSPGSGVWQQISDTLCYAVSSTGVQNNVNGWHCLGSGYSALDYRDWNKVAINLNKYLFEDVRIEIYMGDCAASGHYGYCYVAGDCQPMEIRSSGCPAGATSVVDTLRAPTGLTNYVWYKSNIDGRYINSLTNVPASVNFTQLTPSTSTNNEYLVQVADFMVTEGQGAGTATNNMVFRCDMTSAMDPAKPFVSKLYARVINNKPLMSIDTLKNCDAQVNFENISYVPGNMVACDTSITKWWFYSGSNENTTLIDSTVGRKVMHQYDSSGYYAVKVRSFYREDHECYTDQTYTIFSLGRPTPQIYATDHEYCVGESALLEDRTYGSVRRDWIFNTSTGADTVRGRRSANGQHNQTYQHLFTEFQTPVELVAYNGLFTRDSINTYDTIWCTASAFDTFYVFTDPELNVSGDTVVCNGQMTNITVGADVEVAKYKWYSDSTCSDASFISEGATLRTAPYADTCVYYVKVFSKKGCSAVTSVNAYRVNPTLSISRHDMCAGDSVTLTSDAAYWYEWNASPMDSMLFELVDSLGHMPSQITVNPKTTTTYTLIGHGTNDCAASPLTETITVHPIPVATADFDPGFIDSDNPIVTLSDVSPYSVSSTWYIAGSETPNYGTPYTHNFGEVSDDSVDVTLVAANDLGCSDTLDFKLPVVLFTYYAPNIFTPERPDNNTFKMYTTNEMEHFHVHIYDRAGRLVYQSNDLHFEWDGTTLDGKKCPQSTYVYVATYRRPGTEDIVTQKGTITLVR